MISPSGPEGPSLLLIEAAVAAVCVAAALFAPKRSLRGHRKVSFATAALARRRGLCVCLVGVCAVVLRLFILPFVPVPKPVSEPDFSFLLAADTFASGRLTNPPPPMWKHFESIHITVFPTYMSMYFPGQGLVLAAGKLITGNNPWLGILVVSALMSAALCWMLQGWLPPKWALLGGVLCILRIGLFSYWVNSYTGGSLAALGGALVTGALPRIWRRFRAPDLFWLGLGIAILAISRPYEGLLLCLPALAVLAWKIQRRAHPSLPTMLKRSAPGALCIIGALAFMAYYDHVVFGSVFTPPYKVDRDMYASAPHFLWQSARPEPSYRHASIRKFYSGFERRDFLEHRTLSGLIAATLLKAVAAQCFFFGVILLIPTAALPLVLKDRRVRPLIVIGSVSVIGLAGETWMLPHYIAPLTAVLYALLIQCMRHMRAWRFDGRASGIFLLRAIPGACALLCVVRLYAAPLHIGLPPAQYSSRAWFGTQPFGLERDRVRLVLERQPGKQLVFVRYSSNHSPMDEWVYNSVDIDRSKVVWARDMSPTENAEIERYYRDRTVWLMQPDSGALKLLH